MKIQKRNIATIILAILCAIALAIGVSFVMPKDNAKSVNAASGFPISKADLDAMSSSAGYANFGALCDALDNGKTFYASNFGSYVVSFGGMSWWPVLVSGDSDSVILTLLYKDVAGNYTWSDGTNSSSTVPNPASNDYTYSWIRAAINAGQTEEGEYYGKWGNNSSTQQPTAYSNSVASPKAAMAPTEFKTFSAFVSGGQYAEWVVPGPTGDNVWLPSADEAKLGGSWDLTATQCNFIGASYFWTRSAYPTNYTLVYAVSPLGAVKDGGTHGSYSIRPAISIEISDTTVSAPAMADETITYDGNSHGFTVSYDTANVELTSVSGKDFKENVLSVCITDVTNGELTVTDAGIYTVVLNLKQTAVTDGKQWCDEKGGTEPRMYTFTINQKEISAPTVPGNAQEYNGNTITYNFANYEKSYIEVTGVKVTSKEGSYTLVSTGANSWAASDGRYPVTLDDSGSIVQVKATEAGTYTLEYGLLDAVNTTWATSTHTTVFTIERASITVTFGAPTNSGFSWQINEFNSANPGYLSVQSINNVVSGENVTLDVYWYSDADKTKAYNIYTTGVPDTTKYDVTQLDSFGVGTYRFCAVLSNDSNGANVNRNYKITTSDTNVSPTKEEVAVQQLSITAGTASLDNVKWQYQAGSTGIPANLSGATLTYDSKISYTVTVTNYPSYCNVVGYTNATNTNAGTYTATVKLEIDSAKRGDNTMPKASEYNYGGEGDYAYVDDYTCTITYKWTIEKKEVTLTGLPFYYSNDLDDNGNPVWIKYDGTTPPESTGLNVKAMIDANDYPEGVTGATFVAGTDMIGPGTITFDFEFTLDGNHKAAGGSTTAVYTMNLTGKQIKVQWQYVKLLQADGSEWKSNTNVTFMYYQLKLDPADEALIKNYLTYEYYTDDPANGGTIIGTDMNALTQIITAKSDGGMGACDNPVTVYVRPVLSGVKQVNGVDQYVLKFSSSGGEEYKKTTIGDNKSPVTLSAGTLTSMSYGETVNSIADAYSLTKTDGDLLNPNFFTVNVYDKNDVNLGLASAVDFSALDAGEYTLVFAITTSAADTYVLTDDVLTFKINPRVLVVPTLKDGVTLTFSGVDQQLSGSLQNWDDTYMEFASNSIHEAYHAGTYKAVIKIKDAYAGNYVFAEPAVIALADGEETNLVQLSADKTSVVLPWSIEKYVIDTTQTSAWNFAADGATLSYNGMPASVKALITGANPTLNIQILYYDLDGNYLFNDVGEGLKGGDKYLVAAYLDPNSTDYDDVEFKNQAYDPMTSQTTSPQMSYTVPQSGAAALMGKIADFMTGTLLGLPVWAWFLIGLALLILLIIIIVVAAKRRKTKEQREEIKAKKEEEKQRKEEERQRREEERQAQKERLEAERELAKAKQEAELEKIRAQAGMGMAGAGMATMAMQQQPQPQSQPQPAPQYAPMQQPYDNGVLARIEADLAEIKARQNMSAGYAQAPMQMSMPMPMQMPMAMPQYMPMPQPQGGSAGGGDMMSLMQTQLAEMRAEQNSALKTELEIMKLRIDQKPQQYAVPQQFEQAGAVPNGDMEKVGALAVAIWRKMNSPATAAAIPQSAEESTQSVPAQYPSDAVITTTTTVDTTKSKPVMRSREETENFDVDGFYDEI